MPPRTVLFISEGSSYSIVNLDDSRLTFSDVDQQSLTKLTKQKNIEKLKEFAIGGVESIAFQLQTNLENGLCGDKDDFANRREIFGTNTFKKPPSLGLLHFVREAFKDFTIINLLSSASLSLCLGIERDKRRLV